MRNRIVLPIKIVGLLLLLLLLFSFCPRPARAQASPPGISLDPAGMEAFFDGVFAAQREALRVSGAAVAVAAGGRILFAEGYGFADLEKGC